jgi:hypothetical protein
MLATCMVAVLTLVASDRVEAASYTYTLIDSCQSGSCVFLQRPSINDSGVVAYTKGINPVNINDSGRDSVIASNGVTFTTIATDVSGQISYGNADINNSGQVAYSYQQATNNGPATSVHVGDGTTDSAVSPLIQGQILGDGLAINNAGTVAYLSYMLGASPTSTLYATNGVTTNTIATNSSLGGLSFDQGVSINNSGTVAFVASDSGGSGVFTGTGGSLTTLAQSSAGAIAGGGASLNDSGLAAWAGSNYNNSNGYSIYTSNGGTVTSVANTANNSGFYGVGFPSLNNAGDVAFVGENSLGNPGLFFTANGTTASLADNVVSTGDSILGGTVTALSFFNNGLNDNGQMVFYTILDYQVGNSIIGYQAIVRADPVGDVPEPATLLLLGSGLVFSLRRRFGSC